MPPRNRAAAYQAPAEAQPIPRPPPLLKNSPTRDSAISGHGSSWRLFPRRAASVKRISNGGRKGVGRRGARAKPGTARPPTGFQKLPGGGGGRAVVAAAWSLPAAATGELRAQSHWAGSADPGAGGGRSPVRLAQRARGWGGDGPSSNPLGDPPRCRPRETVPIAQTLPRTAVWLCWAGGSCSGQLSAGGAARPGPGPDAVSRPSSARDGQAHPAADLRDGRRPWGSQEAPCAYRVGPGTHSCGSAPAIGQCGRHPGAGAAHRPSGTRRAEEPLKPCPVRIATG